MNLGKKLGHAFGLEGENWMRHSNPASVWTRFGVLPLLAGSIWSRKWIGRRCLIPLGLSTAWLFANPLFFRPPRSTKNWASKGVLGERIWVNHDRSELPDQFNSVLPTVASSYQAVGLAPLAYGLIALKGLPTVTGVLIVQGGKLWYIDRMVLLFDEMKTRDPEYAAWEY
jgi:peptidoglycan/xylan/chitin deacetylase (PgdA/CDA1 family)